MANFFRWLTNRATYRLAPGDLCSILSGMGTYGVVKVLVVEDDVVHVRLYREKFPERPNRVAANSLTLGSIHEPGDHGVGHLPLSPATFRGWAPIKFQSEPVTDDELDGYRYWRGDGGGAW